MEDRNRLQLINVTSNQNQHSHFYVCSSNDCVNIHSVTLNKNKDIGFM